jgi:hypothetical protein
MEMTAAMMPAAEMVTMASTTMATTVMTATTSTAVTAAMTAFRDRKIRHRQRGGEGDRGNSHDDL